MLPSRGDRTARSSDAVSRAASVGTVVSVGTTANRSYDEARRDPTPPATGVDSAGDAASRQLRTIRLVVTDATGEPTDHWTVTGRRASVGGCVRWTADDGPIHVVAPDEWTFWAESSTQSAGRQGVHDLFSDAVMIDTSASDEHDVDLRLRRRASLFGRIAGASDLWNPRVVCRSESGELVVASTTDSTAGSPNVPTYSAENLASGPWEVFVLGERRQTEPARVVLSDGPLELDLDATEVFRPGDLRIRAFDPDGNSVDRLSFQVSVKSGDDSGTETTWISGLTQAKADGTFLLRTADYFEVRSTDATNCRRATIRVRADGLGERTEYVDPRQVEVLVRFQRSARLDVVLDRTSTRDDSPAFDILLRRVEDAGDCCEWFVPSRDESSPADAHCFTGLQPGVFDLGIAWTGSSGEPTRILAARRVSVAPGPNRADLRIPVDWPSR
jgi:hypothetical protein